MEHRSNNAAMKDALIKSKMEECVLGTERRRNPKYAVGMDALILSSKEECV
jgi:hypothetical protein